MKYMDADFEVTKDSPLTEIFAAMKKYYKADIILEKALHTAKHTFYEFAKDPANTRLDSLETFQKYSIQLLHIQQKIEAEKLPADKVENIVKNVKNNLGKSHLAHVKVAAVQAVRNKFDAIDQTESAPKTLRDFQAMLGHFRFDCLEAMKTVEDMGLLGSNKRGLESPRGGSSNKRGRGRQSYEDRTRQFDRRSHRRSCYICNHGDHAERDCWSYDHPDGNHENKPFEQSEKGLLWAAKGYHNLPRDILLNGDSWESPTPQQAQSPQRNASRGRHSHRGGGGGHRHNYGGRGNGQFQREYNKFNNNNNNKKREREIDNDKCQESVNSIKSKTNSQDNSLAILQIMPQVAVEAEEEEEDTKITVRTLFDSGATSKNYISTQIAQELHDKGANICDCNKLVCSSLGNEPICKKSQGTMKCTIVYKDEHEKEYRDKIEATIIESSLDLILGRETMKDLNIVDKFPSHFKRNKDNKTNEKDTASDFENEECTPSNRYPKSDTQSVDSLNVLTQRDNIIEENRLSREERDYDGIDENDLNVFPWHQFNQAPNSQETMPYYHGDNERFNNALKATCEEYRCVFSTQINVEPARIPPMKLEVNEEMWSRCHKPMREMSEVKKNALRDHLKNLTDHGIIQPSSATSYSHPHLPPKSDGTYRFTCDFRELNAATKPRNNFIPNIEEMIRRIGHKKPKYFGTLDLTNGYWQIALDRESMKYTAFICCFGILEFCRLAMGLKNAAGYFQSMLASLVLVNLIYYICELYIDDLLIHANSEEEFIANLKQVLQRFKDYNLVANPRKCHLGMKEAEFVGKLVDTDGVSFTRKRLTEIGGIDLPKTANDLKKFLGLFNYFRQHIQNAHEISAPLNDMIVDYDKRKHRVLNWQNDTTKDDYDPSKVAAFERAKQAIMQCPRLYFWLPERATILCTDASERGVGGYLYQIEVDSDGNVREFPIGFVSKGFTSQQRRWAIPDKEAFSIYYCVKKFDHILRDIQFTIKTDHKNLLYLDKDPQAKIRRYKIALQEYDCKWEYINTHDNVVADDFSRLCSLCDITDYDNNEREWINALNQEFILPEDVRDLISQVHNSKVGHFGVEKTTLLVEKLLNDDDIYKELRELLTRDINAALARDPTDKLNHKRYIYMRRDIRKRDKVINQVINRLRATENLILDKSNIRRFVRKFIQTCPCCQKMSQLKVPINTIPFTTASTFPMERLNIDTIGPLKSDERGNEYIIAIIDCFTRWIGLYPVRNTSAECAVDALIEHFGIFGCPAQLLSDNGSQFVNNLIKEFTKLIGTEHVTTMAYSKEENAIIERSNKESMRHLKNLIMEYKDTTKWNRYSKLAQRILNATVHESIGVSPAQLLFGNAIDLDRGLFTPIEPMFESDVPTAISQWAMEMLNMQRELMLQAKEVQEKRDSKNIKRRTPEILTEFPVNSYVLIGYPTSSHHKGPPTKFHANLKGPMQVVKSEGARYTVRNLVTKKLEDYHITLLREFKFDDRIVDPIKIAMCDEQFYEVEKVLEHRGSFDNKKNLFFKVKWFGYENEDNTWEPWKNLRTNVELHNYLRNNNLQAHIPKNFK